MAEFLVIRATLLNAGERVEAATWQEAALAHCQDKHAEGHFATIPVAAIRRARSTVTRGDPTVTVQPDS